MNFSFFLSTTQQTPKGFITLSGLIHLSAFKAEGVRALELTAATNFTKSLQQILPKVAQLFFRATYVVSYCTHLLPINAFVLSSNTYLKLSFINPESNNKNLLLSNKFIKSINRNLQSSFMNLKSNNSYLLSSFNYLLQSNSLCLSFNSNHIY